MKPFKNTSISLKTLIVCLLALLAATVTTRAQTLVDNLFTNPNLDLVTNGIVGSGFDGADLALGDNPNPNTAGLGNGATTLQANDGALIDFPGAGDFWVEPFNDAWGQGGAGNTGFFAYNIVYGDFIASIEIVGPYPNLNYTFSGLMARAVADGAGDPFNGSENWESITEFAEFGILTMSDDMLNGGDVQTASPTLTPANLDAHGDIWLQLSRSGNVFTMSDSPDGVTWTTEYTHTRTDLAGVAMQVGISAATFNVGVEPLVLFTDYQLDELDQTITPPADPSAIVIGASNPSGSQTLSWTKGAGSAGSVVVIRENKPILQSPFYGFTYVGNLVFNPSVVTNMGAEQQVVYAGSGNSVTVTGLGGSNNNYSVAVYSYSTTGGTNTYDANPAVASFNGPGVLTGVSFVTTPPAIPLNGAGLAIVTACYSTGDCYNVSGSPDITLQSSSPSVTISGEVMNGISIGSATITATFAGISGTQSVSVVAPVFTDSFGAAHDYVAGGLINATGPAWDGEYLNYGDVPNGGKDALGDNGRTLSLDADITNPNILSLNAAGGGWENAGSDGPFLFKIVTGDFEASVHITTMNTINFNGAGLMARLFENNGDAGQGGAGGNGGETHMNWWKDQAGALSARYTLDGTVQTDIPGLVTADSWLLMQRSESTNFYFYESSADGGAWALTGSFVVPEAANNATMEVGIAEQMNTASDGTAEFDTFMLNGPGVDPSSGAGLPAAATGLSLTLNNDLSMTANWTAANGGSPVQSMLVFHANSPVNAQPPHGYLFDSGALPFGSGSDLGDGNWVVFRSAGSPASVNNSTVVTGLTPGTTYYAAVYTWLGGSTSKAFQDVNPPTASLLDGTLISVTVLPPPSIPAGGIGQLQVLATYAGTPPTVVNVSQFATLTSLNTSIAEPMDGVITGYVPGSATIDVSFGGFNTSVTAVVRAAEHTDNFTTSHDYVANGETGTLFNGAYLNYGDIPEQSTDGNGNNATDATLDLDANITSPGLLTMTNNGGGYEFAADDGTFLYKYVTGDFQEAVHLNNYSDTINYTIPGLFARAYSVSTTGGPANNPGLTPPVGAPLDGAGGECTVRMGRFDEYGIGTYPEITIDNNSQQLTQGDQGDGQNWLLLVRQNYTNFNVYQRSGNTGPGNPWHLTPNKTSMSNSKFAGVPMQVGLELGDFFAGQSCSVQWDTFMLDCVQQGNPITLSYAPGTITITWNYYPGAVLQSTSSLSSPNWQTVGTVPTYTTGLASVTLPSSGPGNLYFRLIEPAP